MTGRHWHRYAAAALLALHAGLVWLTRGFAAGTTHSDEATYMFLARSIRAFAYRDIYLADAPIHAQYPPGFPAFLALLSLPFGERYDVYIAGIALCSVAALALIYEIVRRLSGSGVALVVLALCAVNPDLLLHASKPYSEPLSMLFATLAIWAVTREEEASRAGETTRGWPALAIVTAICAALTRSAGVTIVLALIVVRLLDGRLKRSAIAALGGAAIVGGWLAWTALAPGRLVGRSYVSDATYVRPDRPGFFATIVDRVATNVEAYAAHLPFAVPLPTVRGTSLDNVIVILALLVLGAAGIRVIWKKSRLVVVYLVVYAVLLIAWPWNLRRFLTPVLPLVLWALVEGALTLARAGGWRRIIPVAAVGGIFFAAVRRDIATVIDAKKCFRTHATSTVACFPAATRGFFDMANFVKRSTADTAILVTANESTLSYLSERRVLSSATLQSTKATSFVEQARSRGSELIALSWIRTPEEQALERLFAECRALSVEKEFGGTALLLRVRPRGQAPGDDACAALDRYKHAEFDRTLVR